jgi:hypothetical protein
MKIHVNSDKPTHAAAWVIDTLEKKGLYTENPNSEIVWNVDSIHNSKLKRGVKLTIYWELDDFMSPGHNPQFYDVDLLYINSPDYLSYYPKGTKILRVAANPDFHRELPVEKVCDYIFVGSIEPLPVYWERIGILDKFLRSGENIFITYGNINNYPELMSKGRVIINILPKIDGRVCINQKFYEAMATGCLMVDYHPMMDDIAIKDVHYTTLDRFGKITDEEINKIKKASRELIVSKHTWGHRVDQVVKDINEYLGNNSQH